MDQKDVLKAILNVRKYTAQLKQNVMTNVNEVNSQVSKGHFNNFTHTLRSSQEISNIYIQDKDQCREDQMEQPHPRLKNGRRNDIRLRQTISSANSYQIGLQIQNMSACNSPPRKREPSRKPIKNMHSFTYTHLQDTESYKYFQKEALSKTGKTLKGLVPSIFENKQYPSQVQNIDRLFEEENPPPQALLRGRSYKSTGQVHKDTKPKKTAEQNQPYLSKIVELELVIEQYQKVLFAMKAKIIALEAKLSDKVACDQFIDVLSKTIEEQQVKHCQLNIIIEKQQFKIRQYEQSFVKIIGNYSQKFNIQISQLSQLQRQNQVMRSMLKLANPILIVPSSSIESVVVNIQNEQSIESRENIKRKPASTLTQMKEKWGC